jgi:HEAT repeats
MRPTTTIIAGGVCLLLAAWLWERPFGGAPQPPLGHSAPVAQDNSGPDASAGDDAALTPKPAAPQEEPQSNKDAWLTALSQLEFEPFDQAAPLIARALQCPDREVRLRAVDLLVAAKDNPSILQLLGTAQSDPDMEVRREAAVALANSPLKDNLTPYLLRGASDMDPEVREASIQAAWSLTPEQRDGFIAQSVNSSEPDVSSAAFDMLQHERSAKTVALLLNVYATNDTTRIQQANQVMSGLVDQTFDNAAEAAEWWRDHQGDYNDDLSAKTDDSSANL